MGSSSGWLGSWQSAAAAAVFLFKQAVDVRGGEKPEETSGDVAEFAARLLASWLVARLGGARLQLEILIAVAGAALAALVVLQAARMILSARRRSRTA